MPFIGKQPEVGAYSKLDAITTSATATYNLTLGGGAYYPSSANHLLVSLNGVMQAPQDSFTVSGSTIVFASTLASTDSIDFIMALGDVLDIGTPSDGTVTSSKLAGVLTTPSNLTVSGNSTVSGDLIVDTDTLKVDSTTNKVGVGTTSAIGKLSVFGGSVAQMDDSTESGDRVMHSKRWLRKFASTTTTSVATVDMTGHGGSQVGGFVFTYTYRTMYGFNGGGGGHGRLIISGRCSAVDGSWAFDAQDETLQGDTPVPILSCVDNSDNTATIRIQNPSSTHSMGELMLITHDCIITAPTY
jgi:hypothetical protein